VVPRIITVYGRKHAGKERRLQLVGQHYNFVQLQSTDLAQSWSIYYCTVFPSFMMIDMKKRDLFVASGYVKLSSRD
jgi:hypothetical protein